MFYTIFWDDKPGTVYEIMFKGHMRPLLAISMSFQGHIEVIHTKKSKHVSMAHVL